MSDPVTRTAGPEQRAVRAWEVLRSVLDPEVPALSVCDLGIVRDVVAHDDAIEIVLTPTYSGCPATEVIEQSVIDAIGEAGLGPARVTLQRAPAWTTDWISDEGRRKLRRYATGRGHRLPALRQRRHRAPVRLRFHRMQGALPLPRVPRAVRVLQAHLSPQR